MTKLMITCLHDLISTENCLNENLKKTGVNMPKPLQLIFFL